MSSPSLSVHRRVPPPCWTHQETLSLIEAYRDKWFSLNRGNLRSADWDGVAASVAEASVPGHPPKSSLQCRHKIEKLRKRYRMEKKRCLDYPGRFFSSWDLFPLLDAMSIGSSPGSKRCRGKDNAACDNYNITNHNSNSNDLGDGFRAKPPGDRYLLKKCNDSSVDEGFDPDVDLGLDQDLIFRARKYVRVDDGNDHSGGEFSVRNPVGDMNSVSVAFRPKDFNGRVNSKSKDDINFHCDYVKVETPQGPRLKAYEHRNSGDSSPDYSNVVEGVNGYVGFPLKSLGNVPPGFNPKIYRNPDDRKSSPILVHELYSRNDKRDRFAENVIVNGLVSPPSPPSGFRQNDYCNLGRGSKHDFNSKVLNGIDIVQKSCTDNINVRKVGDPIMELVSAIRLSTKSFVKVEKMKIEVAMEMEKMRMDAMLKHNQMILESQQQIVDALAKTALENNKKKKKKRAVELSSPCQDKNGETQVAATDSESIDKSGIAKEE